MNLGEFFTIVGFMVGALVFWLAAKEKRLSTEGMAILALIGATTGAVGAKLTQLVIHGGPTASLVQPSAGGKSLLGGVLFGWLGIEVSKRIMGIRRSTGDLFALALPAGEAIGRIGCYLNECCFGTPFQGPWSVYSHGAWRHPAQIYAAIIAALTFMVLFLTRKRAAIEGDLFRWYLIAFGGSRFILEFVRDHDTVYWGLTSMQWYCVELLVGSSIWMIWSKRKLHLTNSAVGGAK